MLVAAPVALLLGPVDQLGNFLLVRGMIMRVGMLAVYRHCC